MGQQLKQEQPMEISDIGCHVNKLVGFCAKMLLCMSLPLEQSKHANGAVTLH